MVNLTLITKISNVKKNFYIIIFFIDIKHPFKHHIWKNSIFKFKFKTKNKTRMNISTAITKTLPSQSNFCFPHYFPLSLSASELYNLYLLSLVPLSCPSLYNYQLDILYTRRERLGSLTQLSNLMWFVWKLFITFKNTCKLRIARFNSFIYHMHGWVIVGYNYWLNYLF